MTHSYRVVLALCALILAGCCSPSRAPGSAPAREHGEPRASEPWYESEIRAYEAADRADPPQPERVLFIGSSSIRMWKSLDHDMAPTPVLNRGFGGSKTDDVLAVMDRIVFPYEPSAIVYYCGDNDLGETNTDSASAAAGFIEFAERVEERQPGTPILYLSIKPSLARWSNWEAMRRANELVAHYATLAGDVDYLDVASCLLGPDGTPREDLFAEDGLHLNAAGYAEWTRVVRPRVRTHVLYDGATSPP
jgi:lysophospholipase L1-like esterase